MLCLGGSFDPVHVGHLITARFAAELAGFSGVRLVVSGVSPFKAGGVARGATPAERVAMCRVATAGDAFFTVDDRETRRAGPSYTADTCEAILRDSGRVPAWLIGADLLPTLPLWHRAGELLSDPPSLVRFVAMRRAGVRFDLERLPPEVRGLASRAVAVPAVEVSSTLIRARVATGRSVRHLVPDAVRRFIDEHRLYR